MAVIIRGPIVIGVHEYQKTHDFLWDSHSILEVGVVCSGKMRRDYPGFSHVLGAGEVWVHGLLEPHNCGVVQVPCKVAWFMFDAGLLLNLAKAMDPGYNVLGPFTSPPADRPRPRKRERDCILRTIEVIETCQSDPHIAAWAHTSLFEILLQYTRGWEPRKPRHSAGVHQYERLSGAMELVLREKNRFVGVREGARACAMSRNTFSSLFRRVAGVSFPRFSLGYRLNCAALELVQNKEPIERIAAAYGFTDYGHFFRAFSKHYGCSPASYRKDAEGKGLPQGPDVVSLSSG